MDLVNEFTTGALSTILDYDYVPNYLLYAATALSSFIAYNMFKKSSLKANVTALLVPYVATFAVMNTPFEALQDPAFYGGMTAFAGGGVLARMGLNRALVL